MAGTNKKSDKKRTVAGGGVEKNKTFKTKEGVLVRQNVLGGAPVKRVGNSGKVNLNVTERGGGSKKNLKNKAIIKVVGVGGGGGNAISRMKESFIRGVEFIAINTDTQDLEYCSAHKKVCIGKTTTRGLGTGMNPELGRQAAEENQAEIAAALSGADLVFVTAGLGGGTGSGAITKIAETAKDLGSLVVAVVTKPFSFEGGQRSQIADEALVKLKEKVDAFIVVPNDKIFQIINHDTTINKAFESIDNVLKGAVQGIAELIAAPGMINVDYADVKAVMYNSGEALVGIGVAGGKERGVSAVRQVLEFPLLEVAIDGARGVLFGISGGRDLKMAEINEIAKLITDKIDPLAKIIFGAYKDRKVPKGKLKVTLIATGFSKAGAAKNNNEVSGSDFEIKVGSLFGGNSKPEKSIKDQLNKKMVIDNSSQKDDGGGLENRKKIEPALKNSSFLNGEDKESESKKKSSEIWDIPAFLRRKKK